MTLNELNTYLGILNLKKSKDAELFVLSVYESNSFICEFRYILLFTYQYICYLFIYSFVAYLVVIQLICTFLYFNEVCFNVCHCLGMGWCSTSHGTCWPLYDVVPCFVLRLLYTCLVVHAREECVTFHEG